MFIKYQYASLIDDPFSKCLNIVYTMIRHFEHCIYIICLNNVYTQNVA